jgi:hypothetical protein
MTMLKPLGSNAGLALIPWLAMMFVSAGLDYLK